MQLRALTSGGATVVVLLCCAGQGEHQVCLQDAGQVLSKGQPCAVVLMSVVSQAGGGVVNEAVAGAFDCQLPGGQVLCKCKRLTYTRHSVATDVVPVVYRPFWQRAALSACQLLHAAAADVSPSTDQLS